MMTADSANDIRITRVYDAPLSLVWEVWTVGYPHDAVKPRSCRANAHFR